MIALYYVKLLATYDSVDGYKEFLMTALQAKSTGKFYVEFGLEKIMIRKSVP